MSKSLKTSEAITHDLAKALSHPLRVQILAILHREISSPNRMARELDQPLGNVAYHSGVLEKYGAIELVKTAQRRGAVEHYFRAAERAFFTEPDWETLPQSIKDGISSAVVAMIVEDAREALLANTFDEIENRHLSRTPMIVDEKAWEETVALLAETLDDLISIQEKAAKRLARKDEEGMPMKVGIMQFKSPGKEARKAISGS